MIRNLIYLDSEKLRSFSSQIFEGITEKVISFNHHEERDEESQRGPVASGRAMANILATSSSSSESKFLEDYAYSLFEDKLSELNMIHEANGSTVSKININTFIKVSGIIHLNDLKASSDVLKKFNDIGRAMWRVENEQMQISSHSKTATDAEVRKKAAEIGLQLNEKAVEAASTLINFGFGDLLEAIIYDNGNTFTSPLKRDFLREDESMLLHKYSRTTQINFTLVGLVTRKHDSASKQRNIPDVKDSDGIREAMRTLALHMNRMEGFFLEASPEEVLIDPIALYSLI